MIDAGLKALSTDMGNPEPVGLPVVRYRPGGDEHGILEWDGAPPAGLAAASLPFYQNEELVGEVARPPADRPWEVITA